MAQQEMKIYRTTDPEFAPYGKRLDLNCEAILDKARRIPMPESGASYEPSRSDLESDDLMSVFQNGIYGEMPIQIGYCWGRNERLNALEWHKSSEINIATEDLYLMLGKIDEMNGSEYDSSMVKTFLIEKGEAVEIYATTLHFCPCAKNGREFGCIVVLPKGTNVPLEEKSDDPLLFRKNKWLIAHEANEALVARGVYPGLHGENYSIMDF